MHRFILFITVMVLCSCKATRLENSELRQFEVQQKSFVNEQYDKTIKLLSDQAKNWLPSLKKAICKSRKATGSQLDFSAFSANVQGNIPKGPLLFSGGLEVAFWFDQKDPAKVNVYIYGIPEIGISSKPSVSGLKASIIYGCNKIPTNYTGAFLSGSARPLTASFGVNLQSVMNDLYKKVSGGPKDLIEGPADSNKNYDMREIGQESSQSFKVIRRLINTIKNEEKGLYERLLRPQGLTVYGANSTFKVSMLDYFRGVSILTKDQFTKTPEHTVIELKTSRIKEATELRDQGALPSLLASSYLKYLDQPIKASFDQTAKERSILLSRYGLLPSLNKEGFEQFTSSLAQRSLLGGAYLETGDTSEVFDYFEEKSSLCNSLATSNYRFVKVLSGGSIYYYDCISHINGFEKKLRLYSSSEYKKARTILKSLREISVHLRSVAYYVQRSEMQAIDLVNDHAPSKIKRLENSTYLTGCNSFGINSLKGVMKIGNASISWLKGATGSLRAAKDVSEGLLDASLSYSYYYELPKFIYRPVKLDVSRFGFLEKLAAMKCE